MSRPSGLREAKRRATRELIEEAAIELALEHGHEHVTVEAICSACGIARSTFFNHVHSRESAIFGQGITIIDADDAYPMLDRAAPDLLLGMFAVTAASLHDPTVNPRIEESRRTLFATQPTALMQLASIIAEAQAQLTAVAWPWLLEHPEHARLGSGRELEEVGLAVGAATTAGLLMAQRWVGAEAPVEINAPAFQEALSDLRLVLEPVNA